MSADRFHKTGQWQGRRTARFDPPPHASHGYQARDLRRRTLRGVAERSALFRSLQQTLLEKTVQSGHDRRVGQRSLAVSQKFAHGQALAFAGPHFFENLALQRSQSDSIRACLGCNLIDLVHGSGETAQTELNAGGQQSSRLYHTFYFASSGTIFSSSFSVWRSKVSEQLTPTRTSVKTRCRSSTPATGWASSATITSPSRNPARRAGLPSSTDKTSAPVSFAKS